MTTVPARADVPIESTWNHESVFRSFDAWREEYQATVAAVGGIAPFQGTLAQSPERLVEWFDLHAAIARRVWTLYMYPVMWQACDGNNEEIKGMVGQAQGLAGQFSVSSRLCRTRAAGDGRAEASWLARARRAQNVSASHRRSAAQEEARALSRGRSRLGTAKRSVKPHREHPQRRSTTWT